MRRFNSTDRGRRIRRSHTSRRRTEYRPRRFGGARWPLSFETLEPLVMLANGTATIEFTSAPSVVQPGERVDISVRYKLTGNSKSGPWEVKEIALYDDDPLDDDRIAATTGSISQQGTWYYHTFQNIRLSDFDDGGNGVELYAYVDIDDNTFNFADVDDSTSVRQVSIGLPDLRVKSLTVSATTVSPGDSVEIDAVVRNYGDGDAGKSSIGYYFGPTPGSRQTFIGSGDIPNVGVLSPGEESADSPTAFPQSNFKIPNVSPGTYYITAIADDDGEVRESDEGNNSRSLAIVLGRPDLRVTSLSVSATSVSVGEAIEIDAVVRNDGNADAARSRVGYYFGPTPGSRQTFIGEGYIPNIGILSPGEDAADSPTAWPQPDFVIPNVSPGIYYVSAIADYLGDVSESIESNNVRYREVAVGHVPEPPITRLTCGTGPGVTIITHGFQAFAGSGATTPDWTIEMAEAILNRAGGSGSIFVHDPNSNSWVTPRSRGLSRDDWVNSNNEDDEIVLVFDWTWDSDDPQEGWSEAAGDSLFANLARPFDLFGPSIDLLSRPLHFIGHSRGTVVNTQTAIRIDYHFPQVVIDQFTTLDPHPSTIHQDPGLSVIVEDLQLKYVLSIPDNIRAADNYYRQDSINPLTSYEADFDFDGVQVQGAWNVKLNEQTLSSSGHFSEHSDAHLWYLATIDPTRNEAEGYDLSDADFNDWWQSGTAYDAAVEPNSGRSNVGFARSRLGRLPFLFDQMNRELLQSPAAPASIFNGDFEYGIESLNGIPGWERHGGGGNGQLDGGLGKSYLELNGSNEIVNNQGFRRHNDMYIPPSVTGLTFDYWIYDDDGPLFGQNDVLDVLLDSNVLRSISLHDGETDGFVRGFTIPLSSEQVGSVSVLEFRIDGDGEIDSGVRIDNVRFAGIQPGTGQAVNIDSIHAAIVGGSRDLQYDLNGDGQVDAADGGYFLNICNTYVGDTNLDDEFNSADLINALQANRYERGLFATWSQGDWNFDGVFDSADLIDALQEGAYESGPRSAVPVAAKPVTLLPAAMVQNLFVDDRRKKVDAIFANESIDEWETNAWNELYSA